MAHIVIPRCGFPALDDCLVSIFHLAISVQLKRPTFNWNMKVRSLVLRAASLTMER
jgi:hypothetical protein